jgi:hypothetical protein
MGGVPKASGQFLIKLEVDKPFRESSLIWLPGFLDFPPGFFKKKSELQNL